MLSSLRFQTRTAKRRSRLLEAIRWPRAAFLFRKEGHIGKYSFASIPTATTRAGQAMPIEPYSKRKAAVYSKRWGGLLPWDAMEAVIQSPRTGRTSICIPTASAVSWMRPISGLCRNICQKRKPFAFIKLTAMRNIKI